VAAFAAAIAARLVGLEEAPAYVHVEEATDTANRAGLRVFTGTVPDYTYEVDGLRLSGVIGGGPAERAGLREGDVIVEIAGQSIANIYDYTYALELLTVGEPVTVAFLRDGARQTVTLTPDARR
jgi:S1-C subfamily serine protease